MGRAQALRKIFPDSPSVGIVLPAPRFRTVKTIAQVIKNRQFPFGQYPLCEFRAERDSIFDARNRGGNIQGGRYGRVPNHRALQAVARKRGQGVQVRHGNRRLSREPSGFFRQDIQPVLRTGVAAGKHIDPRAFPVQDALNTGGRNRFVIGLNRSGLRGYIEMEPGVGAIVRLLPVPAFGGHSPKSADGRHTNNHEGCNSRFHGLRHSFLADDLLTTRRQASSDRGTIIPLLCTPYRTSVLCAHVLRRSFHSGKITPLPVLQ